jgi:RNA polymerase sigma-70 factor, ECF subfamily
MALGSVCRDMSGPLALLDAGNDDPPQALPPFDDVYTSHAANVYRFCLSQLGDAEAAADVTQDAFIKGFSAYQRVSPDPETTRTWLISIARNCCVDYRRQNGRWQRLLRRLERFRESPLDVEVLAHHHSELERATAAIARLRTRERELIGLRVAADLSFREVATLLGISEEAAKVATRRALRKLRSKLEDKTNV